MGAAPKLTSASYKGSYANDILARDVHDDRKSRQVSAPPAFSFHRLFWSYFTS